MFISSSIEKLQLQKIFLTGRPEINDPFFRDLIVYLNSMDVDPAWITFNIREQKLNIYLDDFASFGVNESILQENISDEDNGIEISNKLNELAANHNYLSEVSDHVEVLLKNFTQNYLIYLMEYTLKPILARIDCSGMAVKPVDIYCGSAASFTIIYKSMNDYDQAIQTKSVFELMGIIDRELLYKDNLNLYKPHTIPLEILHMEMKNVLILE